MISYAWRVTTASPSAAGELVAGRYRLLHQLGAGAMGSVWRAYDERLERRVALKRVLPLAESEDTAELRERVLREGRIAARLQHPNAVAVYDVVEDDGQPVLVMEYLPSTSLAEVLADGGPMRVTEVAGIGAQVAAALAAAHEAGIVHRDVKPGNILMSGEGVKITDFGIAHASGDATITATGVVAGTPAFLAPETVHGRRPLPRSDVFSLGATLYAAVEGVPPFGRDLENPYAVLFRIASGEMREPRKAGALTPVLKAMMAQVPADRPTAEEAAESLRAIADGRELPATRVLARVRIPRPRLGLSRVNRVKLPVEPGEPDASAEDALTVQVPRPRVLWPQPGADHPKPSRGTRVRRFVFAGLAGLLATVAVVAFLLVQAPAAQTSTPAPPATPTISPAELEKAVADYYALLPAQPDVAWTRLAPARQGDGPAAFRKMWEGVARLAVSTPPHAENGLVTVGVEETLTDGTLVRETHRVGFDGTLLAADTLLTSERILPAAPPPAPATVTVVEQHAASAPAPAAPKQAPALAPPASAAGDNGKGKGSGNGKEHGKGNG